MEEQVVSVALFDRSVQKVDVVSGESEGRKSHERESTPKLGASAAGAGSGRRPRTFAISPR